MNRDLLYQVDQDLDRDWNLLGTGEGHVTNVSFITKHYNTALFRYSFFFGHAFFSARYAAYTRVTYNTT